MSQSRTMILGLLLAVPSLTITHDLTGSKVLGMVAGGIGMLIAVVGVWYSPYPDPTHNFGAGVKRQKWGFTSEQDGDKWIREPTNLEDSQ